MRVGLRLNELDVNVHAVACLLHAAFENVRYTQTADLGKGGDNFILNALCEECVLFVRAQIVERQNSDAFVRNNRRGHGSSLPGICPSYRWLTRKEPDRSSDNQESDDAGGQERNIRTRFWLRRRDVGRYRTSDKLLWQRGVSNFIGVKVYDRNGDIVLYLAFAEIVQVPLPLAILGEIFGHAFR